MAQVYPLVNPAGRVVAVCNVARNADQLARKINLASGAEQVSVAEPVAFNPKHTDELIDRLACLAGASPARVGGETG
jgi:hypothetical protein